MKKKSFQSIIILFFLFSCDKEIIDIDLSSMDQQRLVVEGNFTDSLQKNTFTVTWTQRLGSQLPSYAAGVDLSIETPYGTELFEEVGPGTYQSLNEFKGDYGEDYRINIKKDGITHSREIKMPEPIEIVNATFQEFDSINTFSAPLQLNFHINSTIEQCLRFKIETANPTVLLSDTIWTEYKLPIYRIARIPAGDSVFVALPIEINDNIQVFFNSLIRIQLEVIPTAIGDYLVNLKNYSTNNTQEGKLLNPPYFYSNEAYGLGYGSVRYEINHHY